MIFLGGGMINKLEEFAKIVQKELLDDLFKDPEVQQRSLEMAQDLAKKSIETIERRMYKTPLSYAEDHYNTAGESSIEIIKLVFCIKDEA